MIATHGFFARRAQSSIIDFIIAFLIFLTVFIINYYAWNGIEVKIQNTEAPHYLATSIQKAVDVLIKTQGYPIDWELNATGANSIGLALKDNVLSNEKINALKNLNYDEFKDYILSTGDYLIEIKDKKETIYSIGREPKGDVFRIERLVKINNSYYSFIFSGWVE